MGDQGLRDALIQYLKLRLGKEDKLKPSYPLFITQKGGSENSWSCKSFNNDNL